MDAEVDSCWERARGALEREGADAAWQQLEPIRDRIATEREAGVAWLSLLRVSPGRAGLVQEAAGIAGAFAPDPEIALLACDALIRTAERLPGDVPPPEQGAAMTAVRIAQGALETLTDEQRADPDTKGYLQINLANALRLGHLHERALSAYRAALKTQPERGAWWFNLGLLHKAAGDFEAGLEANRRAAELLGEDKPVLWNLAICATALGRGQDAAEAFGKLGIDAKVVDSGMPYVEGLPPVQVRVASVGPGHAGPSVVPDRSVSLELLWVSPLSPCHGVVQSASYRDSAVDYGDVVLWDGVPVDVGEHGGKPVPRFALLAILRKGDEHRFRFVALERSPGALSDFAEALPTPGLLFAHSEEVVRGPHTGGPPPAGAADLTGGLAYGKIVLPADADLPAFRAALDAALKQHGGLELVVPGLLEAIGDTAAAGKAHTMWRGIERTVEKRSAN